MDLLQKLKIKQGMVGKVSNTPKNLSDFETYLAENGFLTEASEDIDFSINFVRTIADVDSCISTIYELKFDGLLWMIYPKKTSDIESELTRDFGWKSLNAEGYKGIAMVAFDDNWSAFRFRSTSLIKTGKK